MKCYICAQQGKDSDAVAACVVCGMGVCMDHVVREEVETWEGGYPFPAKKTPKEDPQDALP